MDTWTPDDPDHIKQVVDRLQGAADELRWITRKDGPAASGWNASQLAALQAVAALGESLYLILDTARADGQTTDFSSGDPVEHLLRAAGLVYTARRDQAPAPVPA